MCEDLEVLVAVNDGVATHGKSMEVGGWTTIMLHRHHQCGEDNGYLIKMIQTGKAIIAPGRVASRTDDHILELSVETQKDGGYARH